MKHYDCFLSTLALFTGNTRYHYEVRINFNLEKMSEILPAVQEEVKECTLFLEQLFRSPGIDRNTIKILRFIQGTLELHFVSVFFQPAKGAQYDLDQLIAAYHANPVISAHNAKRLLSPQS